MDDEFDKTGKVIEIEKNDTYKILWSNGNLMRRHSFQLRRI